MTIDLEPIPMTRDARLADETDEERARRLALEQIASGIGPLPPVEQHAPPPSQARLLDQGLPPPSVEARPLPQRALPALAEQQARATSIGDQFRAAPPSTATPRVVRGPDGREQQVFPPGVMPPRTPESDASIRERFGVGPPDAQALPPRAPPAQPVAPPAAVPPPPEAQAGGAALPSGPSTQRPGLHASVADIIAARDANGRGPFLDTLGFDDMEPEDRPEAIQQRTTLRSLGGVAGGRPSFVGGQAGAAPSREELRRLLEERAVARKGTPAPGPKPAGNAPPDYTGADTSDAIRRPLHNIANAFRVLGGRPANREFRSEGQAARARDAATVRGKQEGMEADADRTLAARRLDLAERGQEAEIAGAAENRALSADRNRISEQMQQARANISEQRAEVAAQLAEAQLGRIQDERAREAAETDPTSQPSRTAQNGVRIMLQGYPPAARERIEAEYGRIDDLDVRTARQVMTAAPAMFRDLTSRAARPRGPGMSPETRATLDTPPSGWAGTPEQWRALSVRQRQGQIAELGTPTRRAGQGADDGEGPELLPGIRGASYASVPETRAFRTRYTQAGEAMRALDALEAISARYGARAVIDPRVEAEIAPHVLRLRGMAAQTQGSGVINPSEVPVINAAIPDPTSLRGRTLGNLAGNLRSWRSSVTDGVTGHAAALGVDDAGLTRITAGLRRRGAFARPAEGAQQEQPAGRRPDIVNFTYGGRTRPVPAAQAEEARRRLRERGIQFTDDAGAR
jgi:hypothetical protein